MPMEDRDITAVAQIAAGLQQRLYQLTSAWPGSPVDVHRLQETVSRACTVLQSSAQSTSGARLGEFSGADSDDIPVRERLSSHLACTRRLFDDLTEILYVDFWWVSIFSITAEKCSMVQVQCAAPGNHDRASCARLNSPGLEKCILSFPSGVVSTTQVYDPTQANKSS